MFPDDSTSLVARSIVEIPESSTDCQSFCRAGRPLTISELGGNASASVVYADAIIAASPFAAPSVNFLLPASIAARTFPPLAVRLLCACALTQLRKNAAAITTCLAEAVLRLRRSGLAVSERM